MKNSRQYLFEIQKSNLKLARIHKEVSFLPKDMKQHYNDLILQRADQIGLYR